MAGRVQRPAPGGRSNRRCLTPSVTSAAGRPRGRTVPSPARPHPPGADRPPRVPAAGGNARGRARTVRSGPAPAYPPSGPQVAEVRRQSTHRLLLATHEVEHAREKELVLRSSLLAAAEAAEQSTSRAEQAGTATLLELLWARRRSSTARRALIEQQAYRFYAQAQLALLLGARPVRNTP